MKFQNPFKKTTAGQEMRKSGKSKKKAIIAAVISGIVIIGAIAFINMRKTDDEITVDTAFLEKGNITQTLSVTGKISGTDSAEISSALSYEIIAINVKEGDYVSKGQVLAVLDDRILRSELEIAKKDVELSQLQYQEEQNAILDTSVKSAVIQVEQSQMEYDEALRQLDIKRELSKSGAIPLEELKQAEVAAEKGRLALDTSNENLRKTKLEIAKAAQQSSPKASQLKAIEIKKHSLAQKQQELDKVYIKSPIEGTVTRVNARLGRTAQNTDDNSPMFIVENLSDLKLKADISEFDISKIRTGQRAEISSDILRGDTIEAMVSSIAPSGEPKDAAAKEMVIPVELDLMEQPADLIAGISASAQIIVDEKQNVFKVPFEALLSEGDKTYIILYNEGLLKKIEVQTGIESDMEIEVMSSELSDGAEVVLNPDATLEDGMKAAKNEQ